MKERWERIQQASLEIRNSMNILEDKDNFYKNLTSFQMELEEVYTWKKKILTEKPSNNQLIHLRNKIRALKQNEMKVKELNAQAIILQTKCLTKQQKNDVENDSKRMNESYEKILTFLIEKEIELKKIINKKTNKHEDDYKNLQDKMRNIESVVLNEHAMLASEDKVREKINNLTKIRKDFDDLRSSYDNVVKDKKEKYDSGDRDRGMSLATSVENLVTKFSDTKTIIEQKIGKLEKGK